jgi:hypothetical protein
MFHLPCSIRADNQSARVPGDICRLDVATPAGGSFTNIHAVATARQEVSMQSSTELVCVDPERISEVWSHVSHLLKAACKRTELNAFADIESDILAGRSLLWLAWNGRRIESAAATILIDSEVGKVCTITACAGSDIKRWLPLVSQIENYASNEGCARVRIYGRKGWLRVLDGYESKYVIMDKELS